MFNHTLLIKLSSSRYLMLAVVFGNSNESTHINETTTAVTALFFIGLAHASSVGIAFFQRHQRVFLLHSLFTPFMIINLIALFNILLNIYARDLFPLSALRVVSIGLPSAFTLIHGGAATLIYYEYGLPGDRRMEADTPLLSEEEMQRRQLARLLGNRSAAAPSPDINHSTYRLEIPTLEPVQKAWAPELSPPPEPRFSSNSKSQWTRVNQSII
ncbi:uncharacterized protein N7484_005415 [Penicillium longicatenatum]|uniref:uncharacterized protein n=1 Tax=Penicillium longicatenatum TaxID=1561947 RepID=UPI002546FCAA|nr:uncharacterized protein N7484_005415 [Penicillium longicatenatum]KAJ5642908.1 hypothetical protein N7484_005415 [Penicillium longicatenatum]